MVKKHKGGRRQILQLEDKKQPSRSESEPSSSAASNNNSCPLDTQVADFFKEIDALTINNHTEMDNSEATCAPSDIASCSKQKDSEESNSLDGLPEKTEECQADGSKTDSGNYCPWQEICDESTGYNYYWNVETNDVTWECPTEYIIYLKSMHSTGGEDLTQSNHSNSNENHKKTKKKKDAPQPPEGAIIPISYFGGSSSEDSSDEEKENGFGTTSKCSNFKTEPNITISSKKTSRKNDSHCSKNKKEPCVEMGPHLPDENHLTKAISSATRTSIPSKEAEMSSKNEVDEYLEIGPQLASNSGMDLSKNIDLNTDCNTVSDSSSKCTNIPHSIKNGQSDASSSTVDDSWEISLKIIEREFKGLDQDIGEDSPDSTVKKGDNFSENTSVPCQTSSEPFGIRGVVEYDNSDEEEEMSSSNISSSKPESVTAHRVRSEYKLSRDEGFSYQGQRKCDSKSEVSQSESQRNLFKRKFSGKAGESEDLSLKKSKQKNNAIDFDKIFNNHSNSGKYGFGFSRQEQLNLESEFFCSTSSHNQSNYGKSPNDYKAINFVKSDHVFDLSTLNKNIPSENTSQFKSNENETEQSSDNKNESIYAPGPSGLNLVRHIQDSKETLSSESKIVHNEDNNFNEKITDVLIFKNNSLTQSSNNEPGTSYEKDRTKDVSSSRVNNSFRVDEDIDEIDRQLSEALEAKKAENIASKPSSSSPSLSPRKKTETDSSASKKTSIESAKFASNAASSESLSDNILNLSSLLIDKLTFLISNHSTLTSLSSLLIQIQTRLMDWQASALGSRYFMSRLQEVEQYLHHYEIGAVSGDWTCQWDRENKRYFYLNSRTQQSQWSYPEELCDKENSWMPSSTDLASTSTASSERSLERDELQTVSSSVPEEQLNNKSSTFINESNKGTSDKYSDSSSMWISESSPPPPPPGVDSPPPPPPQSPPPDSTEVEDLLEDMDIENSDGSNPPLIVTNSGVDIVMPYPKFSISSPERSSENFPSASVTNAVSSTSLSSFEDMNTVSKSPQLVSTSRDTFDTADTVNMPWSASQPSCSTDIASNFDSESEANMLPDPKLLSSDKDCDANASSSSSRHCEVNASSTSNRSCDLNASSTSSRNYDVNASSSSSRNCDVNASSSSYRNCDVNTSSSSYRSSDGNASCSSSQSWDVKSSSSSSRSYICSNEVTTYRKNCGPYPSTSTSVSASTTSKKEKKKAKLSSVLALKKKNIPSLVEKWQKIKEEQEKEDKDSEDPRN